MKLAEPPGVRACKEGGVWEFLRSPTGACWVLAELGNLEDRLVDVEKHAVRAELRQLIKAAIEGNLTYGPGPEGQVEKMAATRDVLELRLTSRNGECDADGKEHELQVRLFFSEPEKIPALMGALMLMWKRPGEIDLELQTEQAMIASRRLDDWDRGGRRRD